MKKIIGLFIAMLLIASVAGAHQLSSDPTGAMTTTFPAVYIDVYSASALEAGNVVVWAIDDSTGDNDAWVESTTTADTGIVAGVVWPNAIAAGGTGTIVIYGMAECDVSSVGVSANAPMCTTGTAGAGDNCAASDATGKYAISTATIGASAQGKCFVDVN